MFSRFRHRETPEVGARESIKECRRAASMAPEEVSLTEAEQAQADERIENYLDQVCGRLLPLSPAERQQIRAELRHHLIAMIRARQELGDSMEEAVRKSLLQFGLPKKVAHAFIQAYKSSGQTEYTDLRRSVALGIRLFGIAGFLTLMSGEAVWTLHVSGVPANGWLSHWNLLNVLLTLGVVPALLGGVMGARRTTSRPVFSTFSALSALCGLTIPLTLLLLMAMPSLQLMLHYTEKNMSLTFFVWMPIAMTAATLSQWVTQRWRRMYVVA
jgi:hypothetical protein